MELYEPVVILRIKLTEKQPSPSTNPQIQFAVSSLSCWSSALDAFLPGIILWSNFTLVAQDTPDIPAFSQIFFYISAGIAKFEGGLSPH